MLQQSALRARLWNSPNAVEDHGINMRNGWPVERPKPSLVPQPKTALVAREGVRRTRPTYLPQITEWENVTTASCLYEDDAVGEKITVGQVQHAVGEIFGIKWKDLVSESRLAKFVKPRHVAMALSYELTNRSLPSVGLAFGGRDHTTTLHAYQKHRDLIERIGPTMPKIATALDWARAMHVALT